MPTLQEILQRQQGERRSIGRTRINRDASLFFPGCAGIFACGIHDVTNQGAGIRLNGLDLLPVHFDLSFDNFRTSRRCHLIWRDGDFVGVEFLT